MKSRINTQGDYSTANRIVITQTLLTTLLTFASKDLLKKQVDDVTL
jgi:hypothetical protein